MKRTIPLLITAVFGFAIAVALFIPQGQEWGERVATWFDILAAIAFILGGGNLVKMHLKKVSDQAAGWGYSIVTLIAFFAMLAAGLFKIGASPAPDQEFYGQTLASLPLADFPQVYSVQGTIPVRGDGKGLPLSVRRQTWEEDGRVRFRGWMTETQKKDLLKHDDTLAWRCTVERLFEEAQPPEPLKGKIHYHSDHGVLGFSGYMTEETRKELLELHGSEEWQAAVNSIYDGSRGRVTVALDELPGPVDPATFPDAVEYDAQSDSLTAKGPLSTDDRDKLADQFPLARPYSQDERQQLLERIAAAGDGTELNDEQRQAVFKVLDGLWSVELLRSVLDQAGKAQKTDKTACEMLEEMQAGAKQIDPKRPPGRDVQLTDEHVEVLRRFAADPAMTTRQLIDELNEIDKQNFLQALQAPTYAEFVIRLRRLNLFTDAQESALKKFLAQQPTAGKLKRDVWQTLLEKGYVSGGEQRELLLADYRTEQDWRATVDRLFHAAHRVKYPWSANYRAQGSMFWWLYEYAFKPLTATMFAMLAFYVASAAFRAFRAKNVEAMLLLGTAFIILLGRTFAGVLVTDWIPEDSAFSTLRIENLTVFIMQVFNTAGNRAIMIGIALGIASTSLKVLLGIDRSYLGSGEE